MEDLHNAREVHEISELEEQEDRLRILPGMAKQSENWATTCPSCGKRGGWNNDSDHVRCRCGLIYRTTPKGTA